MYPHDLSVLGMSVSIWNATFLVGVVIGYFMLRAAFRRRGGGGVPKLLALRWIATVYVATLGAQLFAYLFDLNTTALPPPGVSWARYYLDPLYAAKTLYGAIVFLPLPVLLVSAPWRDLSFRHALDAMTPAVFTVLGVVRIGCFLQGCCYGIESAWAGVAFPPGGAAYHDQLNAGLIQAGEWTRPVVPTQPLEAVGLFAIAAVTFANVRRGRTDVFLPAVAAYSLFRFGLEFLRADPDRNAFGPLSTSQWIALLVLALYAATRRLGRPT
jgi:phosphatidylglycerol:prolipoprotein diacylglycerol transferase